MADVNNKLRLQIVTELDAAGIKATKDQVDALELGLRRAGHTGEESGEKFGRLEKALGKLPGPLGKIGGAMGGLAGKATMIIGAFSVGVEIGQKIVDKLLVPMGLMRDAQKEIIKENKAFAAQQENLMAIAEAAHQAEMKRMAEMEENSRKAIKAIDDETQAYMRQATALQGLAKAGDSAEIMQLERMKFEEMRDLSTAGYAEAAEQVGKYYDVAIEELRVKEQLRQFDMESAKMAKDRTQAEAAYAKQEERVLSVRDELDKKEAALLEFNRKHSANGWYMNEADEKKAAQMESQIETAKRNLERAEADLAKRGERMTSADANDLQRRMERANLAAAGALSVDRAAAAYDEYVAANSNPLGVQIDPSWADELLKNSIDADQTQREILAEVRSFGAMMQNLLEVK